MPQYPSMYPQAAPLFRGFGQAPTPAPRQPASPPWVGDPVLSAVLAGMREIGAGIIQQIVQTFGIRLDRNEEFAWQTFDITPLIVPAGATDVVGRMPVGQEADFVATGIVAQIVDTGVPPALVDSQRIRFRIVDGSTNRQLINQSGFLPMSFLATAEVDNPPGSRPFFLPKPRIFSRNSNVEWHFNNALAGAVDTRIDVAFFGYRIYDIDSLDLTKAR